MYKQLSGGFGYVQVILKEALNGHESLTIQGLQASLLEYLLQKHLAQGGGQLIDQSADTQIFIADDVLLVLKYLADLQGDLRLLVCLGKILDVIHDGGDTDDYLGVELGGQRVRNVGSRALHVSHFGAGLQLLHQNDIMLAHADYVVTGLVGEHILQHFKGHHLGLSEELDQEYHSGLLGVEVKLLG